MGFGLVFLLALLAVSACELLGKRSDYGDYRSGESMSSDGDLWLPASQYTLQACRRIHLEPSIEGTISSLPVTPPQLQPVVGVSRVDDWTYEFELRDSNVDGTVLRPFSIDVSVRSFRVLSVERNPYGYEGEAPKECRLKVDQKTLNLFCTEQTPLRFRCSASAYDRSYADLEDEFSLYEAKVSYRVLGNTLTKIYRDVTTHQCSDRALLVPQRGIDNVLVEALPWKAPDPSPTVTLAPSPGPTSTPAPTP